ncbi:photosystem II reaction center protein Psb28 [filamentous cyanobacterium LEGE 11480]|uniref:Photosystem II reaction center Psb28 protein n=1 Tax=Romeriopsis navalis LEGE 11480 TaxID=2777977 RepID=A0A928VP60_9CYAN|nr:photosystem II reaction center protein Psb28 [Romeriopsis navalis]MBE9031268.1 photosystem II reaction center protein Psb28 [Romeriopsis navalis LEGE 11480]
MTAKIQFAKGFDETVIPDVRLTRSKDGSNGAATFYFENPDALAQDFTADVTGMYLSDEEGELLTRDVQAKFINGKPAALEAKYVMGTPAAWDRFIRFMERYAASNELGFQKSDSD